MKLRSALYSLQQLPDHMLDRELLAFNPRYGRLFEVTAVTFNAEDVPILVLDPDARE